MDTTYKRNIKNYLLDKLYKGNVEEADVPCGIILGNYAFEKGKLPIFISSYKHHGPKTDSLTWIIRSGIFGNDSEGCFIEGINEKSGRKYWKDAVEKIDLNTSFEDNLKRYTEGSIKRKEINKVQEIAKELKDKYGFSQEGIEENLDTLKISDMLIFSKNIENYLNL